MLEGVCKIDVSKLLEGVANNLRGEFPSKEYTGGV